MVSFVNFAGMASICVGFILVHCRVTFSLRLLAKFEFPARISNEPCLNNSKTGYRNAIFFLNRLLRFLKNGHLPDKLPLSVPHEVMSHCI